MLICGMLICAFVYYSYLFQIVWMTDMWCYMLYFDYSGIYSQLLFAAT